MSELKHTPGPWIPFKKEVNHYPNYYYLRGNTEGKDHGGRGGVICSIIFDDHYRHSGILRNDGVDFENVTEIDWAANLKLIQHTPDFLEELISCEKFISLIEGYFEMHGLPEQKERVTLRLTSIRTLIKKATE